MIRGGKIKASQPTNLYRKIKADRIFTGYSFASPGSVLILKEGIVETIIDESDAGEDVEHVDGMITPGFINAHCHTELSHLQNVVPQHTGLVNFVQQVMKQRLIKPDKDESIDAAIQSMYDSGIVAVGDICNSTDSIPHKTNKIYWQNFIEVSGFISATATNRFQDAQKTADAFISAGMNATLVPHAPYSVSDTLFNLLNKSSEGKTITIHNQECEAENEFYYSGMGDMIRLYKELGIDISFHKPTGKSSLQSWRSYFTTQKIIAVHNTCISEDDIDFAKDIIYCICINANLYIENKLPPVPLLVKKKANMVLGTDSLASNNQLSIWNEVQTIVKHFPEVPLESILTWATSNGANALNIQDRYGSFEKGKEPGVVLINDYKSRLFI